MIKMHLKSIHRRFHFVLVWALLLAAPAQGEESLLRWKNGDVLAGELLPSTSEQIRWSSSHFADDLTVDTGVLHSITFSGHSAQPTEAFRVGTIAGDVFTADLIGSSDQTLLFSSRRHGVFQVKRDTIYSLRRVAHPNRAFDGSQFEDWKLMLDGPIMNLSYQVFQGDWGWGSPFPDLATLRPAVEARYTAGYLDLGLSRFRGRFAMSFAGEIVAPTTGKYRFEGIVDDQAHLWIDGIKIGNHAAIAHRYDSEVELSQGAHSLRLHYIDLGGEARLSLRMVCPNGESKALTADLTSGWHQGVGGHPQTQRRKASLFRAVTLPDNFEIDLALASESVPQFVLALGKDRPNAESNQSLRVETWGDELVVVQETVFEPVMTITKDMRELRLQLAFDSDARTLQVFNASGILLATVEGVRAVTGQSGIFIRNRGDDLAVRRLSIYRQSSGGGRQPIDATKPRVHMIDGQVVHGRLFVTENNAYSVDQDGARCDIDLDQVDRIANPGVKMAVMTYVAELSFADGAIMRGWLGQANSNRVMLRTAFSDAPIPCALAGASLLRFGLSATEPALSSEDMDVLFTTAGRLRGRLSFDLAGSPLSWQPSGVAKPLRLANMGVARIERSRQSITKGPSFSIEQFPCTLHLKNGEIIPCRVSSYDKTSLGFESPFIRQREIDAVHIKALEFARLKRLDSEGKRSRKTNGQPKDILRTKQQTPLDVDSVKLERALTVPRFSRDHPPTHILVAKNGDLKRGSLQAINAQTIQFESKQRTQTVAVEHLACIVNVSKLEEELNEEPDELSEETGTVRATLADGSILMFTPIESQNGMLLGRSVIYGEMAIPTERIWELNLSDFEKEQFMSLFEKWIVCPAQEPAFGDSK